MTHTSDEINRAFENRLERYGTNSCVVCGQEFTNLQPCCCDDGCNDDLSLHIDGICAKCCKHEHKYIRQEM